MRLKLDANLPESLIASLTALGHEVDNVRIEGLAGKVDAEVWKGAQQDERFLITQDLDFSDTRRLAPGSHHGLLLLRLRRPGRIALTQRALAVFQNEDVESWARCFVIFTDTKIRVRRAKQ